MMTLRKALDQFEDLTWSDAIFIDRRQPINMDTVCLIHDPDDVEDEKVDLPDVAIELGFDYLMDVQSLQSICLNMREQMPDAKVEDIFRAFLFYLKNDAFIVIQ
ncbi:DUF7716 domain-containing protein [Paracoccus siganidrum]|uniref:DUF7716 domain-containing protein n=2 Tax=Paracoccus siganidrum TaxID=1276757 RepID=A0A418ZTI7_9RHOB|nr:hypothetical protein [Paracoccus siganidrum]RJL01485.1 hypothetical protein D3P05_22285 [Paracoccus siganidrum]RMC28840.1 hypothetical protein C9E82_21095 [Paracoccus siganidrum]